MFGHVNMKMFRTVGAYLESFWNQMTCTQIWHSSTASRCWNGKIALESNQKGEGKPCRFHQDPPNHAMVSMALHLAVPAL